jgi:hypothetical protein
LLSQIGWAIGVVGDNIAVVGDLERRCSPEIVVLALDIDDAAAL